MILHVEMKLRNREQIWVATPLFNLYGRARPGRIRGANLISIKAMGGADATRQLAAVAEMYGDHPVRLAGRYPGGNCVADRATLVFDLQRVDVNVAAFFADLFFQAQLLGSVWTNQSGVVPGYLRQRLWQFLQPAVVGETTVVDRGIRSKHNFERPRTGGGIAARSWDRGRPARIW